MFKRLSLTVTLMAAALVALAGWAAADDADASLSQRYFEPADARQESAGKDAKKKDAKGGKADASKAAAGAAAGSGDEKPFDTVVKDYEEIAGLFRFYRKADENKTLLEIPVDQLDKTFLFAWSVDQSVGERGLYASQSGTDFPFTFHKVGKNIQWIAKNTTFIAPEGTPEARATSRSFPHAILASAKILSKPHAERKSLLIDVTEMFAARDLPGYAIALNQAYAPTIYSFDRDKSSVTGVKVFPENALIEVSLHYGTDNPRTFSMTLTDGRSVPVTLKYEISTLRQSAFQPRVADDRLGHFHTLQQDFTNDHAPTPYVRNITRWNLEKSDPTAALSSPKQPIVFWLENTIPVEYRASVTAGTLLWNKAFEKIGFKDAVVVKQMPDTATWDPADTRYSTIRWFAGVDATFAIGPSRANPYTGEIYDADISISEGIIRNARRLGEELLGPVSGVSSFGADEQAESNVWLNVPWAQSARRMCNYANGLVEQASLGMAMMDARGQLSPETEARLMHEYILELTAHEVGHTLGLRHNFRGSSILKVDDLYDTAKTAEIGQSSSVMDYNPVIVATKGQKQGDFLPITLGPYDYWAIEYAYKPIATDEKAELARIASRAADPMLPYSTDEDANGTYSPTSIDPFANQYDQADDPLGYFKKRVELVHELWGSMETSLAKSGDGYQVLRRALGRGMADMNRSLLTSSKFVGGIYHYRDHVGDPNGRSPYTPVPAAKQREALAFLAENAFSAHAFRLSPSLHNKLAIDRLPTLDAVNYYGAQRLDYPWHNQVLALQRGVLNRLLHPITLARIQDNELRFAAGEKPFKMADLFGGLTSTIWSELDATGGEISSVRRNLQREHLKQLVRLTLRPAPAAAPAGIFGGGATPLPPEDATTLARANLVRIQTLARAKLIAKTPLETTTRAHLQETSALIAAALEAQIQKGVE